MNNVGFIILLIVVLVIFGIIKYYRTIKRFGINSKFIKKIINNKKELK